MHLRRLLAILFAFALVAAACGGDDDDGDGAASGDDATEEPADDGGDGDDGEEPADDGGEEPADDGGEEPADDGGEEPADDGGEEPADDGGDVELTATARGVTAEAITVGISMLDFELLKELQLSPQGWGDQILIYETFIADINANGGINGRMIEPVFRFYSPLGTTEAEAACLELTEDNETFIVLGGFLGPAEPANTCITGRGGTALIGGRQTPERLAEATAPWFETGTNRTRRLEVFMSLLQSEGYLDEGRSIALIGGIQAEEEFAQAGELMRELGVEPVIEVLNEAPDGDIPAQDAVWQALSERVEVSGADTALIITSVSGNIRGLRSNGIDIDIWTVDNDSLASLGESVEPEWADGVVTIQAQGDIEAWEDETVSECRRIFSEANPDIEILSPEEAEEGDEQWYNGIMNYCRWLQAFTLIATEAGPELTHETFEEAAYRLGDFQLPAQPFNSITPDKPDANDSARLGVYDSELGARGEIVPLTDIIDATS